MLSKVCAIKFRIALWDKIGRFTFFLCSRNVLFSTEPLPTYGFKTWNLAFKLLAAVSEKYPLSHSKI